MLRRILLLCCYCGLGAATLPGAEDPEIQFEVASFRGRSGLISLDIYIQFDRAQLEYKASKDGLSAKLAAVALLKQNGQIITFDQLDVIDQLPNSADVSSGSFTSFMTFDLTPGNYDLELAVTDGRGGEFDSTMQLQLAAYAAHETGISDLTLAAAVHPRMSTKRLHRRGFNIYPIADSKINDTDGLLWYYAELYGVTPEDTVVVQTVITDSAGAAYANNEISVVTADLVHPYWGALNTAGLAPGLYELSVSGQLGDDTVSTVHSFTVVAADSTVAQADSVQHSWDKITRHKLERIVNLMGGEIDHVRFIALDSLAQMNMLEEQATALDAPVIDSTTTVLENWIERWQWIRNADPGYRYSGRLTPAGEIVLLYGLPNSISRHGPTAAQRGYQTWQYGVEADTNFVVLLETGKEGVTMLTGDLPGLIKRADWEMALARETDLAAYFAPVEAPSDTSATEELVESEQATEPVAAEGALTVEPDSASVQASDETIMPDSAETAAPEVEETIPPTEPTIQLDESGAQAPAGASDTTSTDTDADLNENGIQTPVGAADTTATDTTMILE